MEDDASTTVDTENDAPAYWLQCSEEDSEENDPHAYRQHISTEVIVEVLKMEFPNVTFLTSLEAEHGVPGNVLLHEKSTGGAYDIDAFFHLWIAGKDSLLSYTMGYPMQTMKYAEYVQTESNGDDSLWQESRSP
mmetsp:Transcript_10817/g.35519  ORF Transcript_10817/g.35519 Transcript_10817/m.35519 type:complete len:134 (-) Transcript_10817:264-665(-)